jgi:hypothetical protein
VYAQNNANPIVAEGSVNDLMFEAKPAEIGTNPTAGKSLR